MSEKIYRVQMNANGMPNFSTAVEVADRPSIDKEYLTKLIQEAVYDGEACARLLDLVDRPQGEWIRTGRTNIYGGIEVQCSNCNDKVMVQHLEDEWYCRHCGADMGMKGADDE